MLDFTGKLFLIVGGSSGIGEQTAITLSRQGGTIILLARRECKLREVLIKLAPGEHAYYCVDVCDMASTAGIVRGVVEKHGKLDGMVYAAGISMDAPLQLLNHEK